MSGTILETGTRPSIGRRIAARAAVTAACLLTRLPPRHIRMVLHTLRRGAAPATYDQALAARNHVTATSTLCSGRYCLPRSLATALLCRMYGTWPTWCTGVRTAPFEAHAWVEADHRPVGEPPGHNYRTMIAVPPG